jgi:hypothetical protein
MDEDGGRGSKDGFSVTEQALGIIRSDGISHLLVITPARVVGRRGIVWTSDFEGYLGPGSKATEEDRRKAQKAIETFTKARVTLLQRMKNDREFTISKESVIRILLKPPGLAFDGRVLFETLSGEVEVKLASYGSKAENDTWILDALVPSLVAFASDRFFDEETGRLVVELLDSGFRIHGGLGWKLKP